MLWSKRYFDKYCGSYRINSVTPKRLLETHNFERKSSLSSEKNILVKFSRNIEHNKYQETIYEGPQGFLAITVEVIESIL